jgi:hypothetical protein
MNSYCRIQFMRLRPLRHRVVHQFEIALDALDFERLMAFYQSRRG